MNMHTPNPIRRLARRALGAATIGLFVSALAPAFATNGANLQPSYYNGGNVNFGWSLMKTDTKIKTLRLEIEPSIAITKEIELTFVFGYTPEEFAGTLRSLAEGVIDVDGLVTGRVGLEGVAGAFTALGDPEAHVKILVQP